MILPDAEDGEQDEKTGEDPQPRGRLDVAVGSFEHVAPAWRG